MWISYAKLPEATLSCKRSKKTPAQTIHRQSSLSEAELSDIEEERPEDSEERNNRDQEAAAIRLEREVSPARKEVTEKMTTEDTIEPRPGPSHEERRMEEEEEKKGRRQATTWSWSVPTTPSTPDIPITILLPKNLDLQRYLPPPTIPRHRDREETLTKQKGKQSESDTVPQKQQQEVQQEKQQRERQQEEKPKHEEQEVTQKEVKY